MHPSDNFFDNMQHNMQPCSAQSPGGYRKDRLWADTYTPEISRIIRLCGDLICAPSEIVVNVAPDREDREECTDYVISIAAGAIACRLRRASYGYRDWTVRHSRPGGIKTEEAKLRAGWGRWYIYGWTVDGKIPHWMLIDLNIVRQNRVLDRGAILSNYDGTQFRAIRHDALEDCLMRGYIDGTWLPFSDSPDDDDDAFEEGYRH